MKMKKYEFAETSELSEKAFKVYSNSDFTFYKDGETFYMAYNSVEKPNELGTLEDVEEFLLSWADDDEEQNEEEEEFKLKQSLMDAIAVYMDDDVREQVHNELAPCSPEEFLRRYCELDADFEDLLKSEFSIELD